MKLHHLRRDYKSKELHHSDLDKSPFAQFRKWFQEALEVNVDEPNAMALATATREGKPSCRTVLMKHFDETGITFYTNTESKKGRDLKDNPFAAATFLWKELERQVSIEGKVQSISPQEAEAYFATRPRSSQLGAWASHQDEVVKSRSTLDDAYKAAEEKYAGKTVPLPPWWGGFKIIPDTFIFWQGRQDRLHDRFRYSLSKSVWLIERLSP